MPVDDFNDLSGADPLAEAMTSTTPPSIWANFFLLRLSRAIRLEKSVMHELNKDGEKLVHFAKYSAYRDAVDAGAKDDADRLLTEATQLLIKG